MADDLPLFTYSIERKADMRYVTMKIKFENNATKTIVKSQLSNIVNLLGSHGNVNELIIYYFEGSALRFNPPGYYEFFQTAIPEQQLDTNDDSEFIDVIQRFLAN